MGKFIDLTGRKFGRLTVIGRAPNHIQPNGANRICWYCDCDCGNKNIIKQSNNLVSGSAISCGCYKKEAIGNALKRQNKFDLSNEYGIGYTSKGEEFYFDIDDYDKIKNCCWYIGEDGYVATSRNNHHKYIKMHKLIMNDEYNNYHFDHINGIRHDNRKCNLRQVTWSQNNMNKKPTRNTSGVVGVRYEKDRNKWSAFIMGKRLGSFITKEEAIKARKEAEDKCFGEYSYGNSRKGENKLWHLKNLV